MKRKQAVSLTGQPEQFGTRWNNGTQPKVFRYELTKFAERDLQSIADYTIEKFGVNQAWRYRDSLFRTFESLTEHPEMGRDYSHVKEGCRRQEHESHLIYYKITDSGILVLRLPHQSQDPTSYL